MPDSREAGRAEAGRAEAGRAEAGRAEATRSRLLSAAAASFAEKGFHATTTRDIASRAGLSSAALYVHFDSKEALLFELSKAGHEHTLELIRSAIATNPTPASALRQAIADFADHHARSHVTARVVNYELTALAPDHLREIRAIRRDIEREVRQLISAGIDSGDFQAQDPVLATAVLLSMGIDLARWYREGGRWTPGEISARYAELALRIVGADR